MDVLNVHLANPSCPFKEFQLLNWNDGNPRGFCDKLLSHVVPLIEKGCGFWLTKICAFVNSFTPMVAYMQPFFNELHSSLITFPICVLSQRLIAQNVCRLFFFNCGISHFYAACGINYVRGSLSGSEVHATFGLGYCMIAS